MRHSPAVALIALISAAAATVPTVPPLATALAAPPRGGEPLLLNGGAENGKNGQPSIWFQASVPADGLMMGQDPQTAHAGKASLFIENRHDYGAQQVANNWGQALQSVPAGRTLVLSAAIKSLDADAANVCLQCWDASGKTMLAFASTPVVRGDQEWAVLRSEPMRVPAEAKSMIVRAALSGKGKAWFDEIDVRETSAEAASGALSAAGAADSGAARAAADNAADNAAAGAAVARQQGRAPDAAADAAPQTLDAALAGAKIAAIEKLPILADQMVIKYLEDWDHGSVDNIAVANNDGGVRTLFALPKLDPAQSAPAGQRFILAAYSRDTRVGSAAPGALSIDPILAEWDEKTSWKAMPKVADAAGAVPFEPGAGWKFFDITPIVREQVKAGASTHGVMLRFDDEGKTSDTWSGYAFVSREGLGPWKDCRPMLIVAK